MKTRTVFFLVIVALSGKAWGHTSDVAEAYYHQMSIEPLNDSTIQHLTTKDPVVAWLLSFPVGMLGLHRVYLGAGSRMAVLYIVTAGGFFGIVPMIDWILLLRGIQDDDISQFVNNRRFIMWR